MNTNYSELIFKNFYYIVVLYLATTLVLGVALNGFVILSYILLIPLSVIGSVILNYNLAKKNGFKNKWLIIIGLAIAIGLINYLLLWFLIEVVNVPFKLIP